MKKMGALDTDVPKRDGRNMNILKSMDNDYLFILQNKYNQLQKENNTLLRDELSVLDENRRNYIKINFSNKILLTLVILFIVAGIVYFAGQKNLLLLGSISMFIIPLVLLIVLIFIYTNVAYFKSHSNINVNDLNTLPSKMVSDDEVGSGVEEPDNQRPDVCLYPDQLGAFNYIKPKDNEQIRDNLRTVGNINESLTKLNALKSHFSGEDEYLPIFISELNKYLEDITVQKPNFIAIQSVPELEDQYNTYVQDVNSAQETLLDGIGAMALRIYDESKNINNDGINASVIFSISLEQLDESRNDYETLAIHFLKAQKLKNYLNKYNDWVRNQLSLAASEYNNKLNEINGVIMEDSSNEFSGHVGVPGSGRRVAIR